MTNLVVHDFTKVYRNEIDGIVCDTCDIVTEFAEKHGKELTDAQVNKIFEVVEEVLLDTFEYPDYRDK